MRLPYLFAVGALLLCVYARASDETKPSGPCIPLFSDAADGTTHSRMLTLPGWGQRQLVGLTGVTATNHVIIALGPYECGGGVALKAAAERKAGKLSAVEWTGEGLVVNTTSEPGLGTLFRANLLDEIPKGEGEEALDSGAIPKLYSALERFALWLIDPHFQDMPEGAHLAQEWDADGRNVRTAFVPTFALLQRTLSARLPDGAVRFNGSEKNEIATALGGALSHHKTALDLMARYLERIDTQVLGYKAPVLGPDERPTPILEDMLLTRAAAAGQVGDVKTIAALVRKFLRDESLKFTEWSDLNKLVNGTARNVGRLPASFNELIEVWTLGERI